MSRDSRKSGRGRSAPADTDDTPGAGDTADSSARSGTADPAAASALVPLTRESKEVALRSAPVSSLVGTAFGVVAAVARLARPKALHPKGVVATATLSVTGVGRTGSPLLDVTGRWPATVRFSRAVGLPEAVPDIGGMAVRIHAERPVDILLASTGTGPLSRFVLTAGWRTTGRTMTSMFPVLVAGRPLLLAAIPGGDGGTWTLQHATPLGRWRTLGRLTVDTWEDDDEDLHFDPVGNRLPGSRYPHVLRALRDPSYPPPDSA